MKYVDSRQAWVVAASGTLILFITLGSNRVNGLFFLPLMNQEGLNRGQASLPFSLPGISVIVLSPVVGLLMNRYSPVHLTFLGSAIVVLSHIPCYFSTNIYVLCIFIGVVKGCGLAILTSMVPVLTATSFQRYRGTAMGISTSGQPLAGMVLPPLVQVILLRYDVEGTFLLMGGISAHLFISCLGYRWYHRDNSRSPVQAKDQSNVPDEKTSLLKPTIEADMNIKENVSDENALLNKSAHDVEVHVEVDDVAQDKHPSVLKSAHEANKNEVKDEDGIRVDPDENTPLIRSVRDKPNEGGETSLAGNTVSNQNQDAGHKRTSTWNTVKKVLTNRLFYLVGANQIATSFLTQVLSQVVIDYLKDKGIPDSLSLYMVTSSSAGELAGRICLGWIPDKKFLSLENHAGLFLFLCSGMTFLIVNSTEFAILMTAAFFMGASQGTTQSMNFVHFAERMTRPEMTLAVTLNRSLHGLSGLLRSPVIGLFRDKIGSYDLLFYFLGGVVAVVAVAWLIEGNICLRKKRQSVPS